MPLFQVHRRKLMRKSGLLKRFRHRVRLPLVRFAFRWAAKLSLPQSHRLGVLLGWCLWRSKGEMRAVSARNIAACLPHLTLPEQAALVKSSLIETGKAMLEVPLLWNGPAARFDQAIVAVHGLQYVDDALTQGKGLVMITPHLGAWEVAGLFLSQRYSMATMYRPSQLDGVDDLIKAGRTRFGAALIAADLRGVRQLYQALKKGNCLGVLPDQDPGRNGGVFAPFFGIPANSMTLVSRILNKSDAPAIFTFAKRLAKGEGYEIFIYPAPVEVGGDNEAAAVACMNNMLEKIIRECPEQYQWSYQRFKTRPAGEAKFYQ